MYKIYTADLYKMYTKCIPHFDKTFEYILYTKLNEPWELNFVQKLVKMWDAFWIHFVYINSDLQKMYIIKVMYAIYVQNSYRMHWQIVVCKINPTFQHILTHLEVKYQIDGLIGLYCINLPVTKWNNCKSPCVCEKKYKIYVVS